jgi:hypothetical protein
LRICFFLEVFDDFFSFNLASALVSVINYFTAFFLLAIATPRPLRVLAFV